jgi:peroxiredoxin
MTSVKKKSTISDYANWPFWMLLISGFFICLFSVANFIFPQLLFFFINFSAVKNHIVGFIFVFIFFNSGISLIFSAFNPVRFWPLIFLAVIFYVQVLFLIVYNAYQNNFVFQVGEFLGTFYCLLVIFGYGAILRFVYMLNLANEHFDLLSFEEALLNFKSNNNKSIAQLSKDKTVLVVFLRHFGCVFCRKLLQTLKDQKAYLDEKKIEPILVTMSNSKTAQLYLNSYNIDQCDFISDSDRKLYRSFGVTRGKFYQIFGLKVWWKTFVLGVLQGYGFRKTIGDAYQMSGVFLIKDSRVLKSFMPEYISDNFDLSEFLEKLKSVKD